MSKKIASISKQKATKKQGNPVEILSNKDLKRLSRAAKKVGKKLNKDK